LGDQRKLSKQFLRIHARCRRRGAVDVKISRVGEGLMSIKDL
jgi:hypothetical protein